MSDPIQTVPADPKSPPAAAAIPALTDGVAAPHAAGFLLFAAGACSLAVEKNIAVNACQMNSILRRFHQILFKTTTNKSFLKTFT